MTRALKYGWLVQTSHGDANPNCRINRPVCFRQISQFTNLFTNTRKTSPPWKTDTWVGRASLFSEEQCEMNDQLRPTASFQQSPQIMAAAAIYWITGRDFQPALISRDTARRPPGLRHFVVATLLRSSRCPRCSRQPTVVAVIVCRCCCWCRRGLEWT